MVPRSVDDPEDVESRLAQVDPAQDAVLFGLDVVQEEEERVEEVVPARSGLQSMLLLLMLPPGAALDAAAHPQGEVGDRARLRLDYRHRGELQGCVAGSRRSGGTRRSRSFIT